MTRRQRYFLFSILFAFVAPTYAVGLPDTGQATCYNESGADVVPASSASSIARDSGSHPRQDCRYGRDAAAAAGLLAKTGTGINGFDYSKIANNGTLLPADAALGAAAGDWACTRDNITGLTWEVKTTSGLRSNTNKYTWYSNDNATNGGNAGDNTDISACGGTLASCNTESYAAAVNAGLCNATDWRLPSQRELLTLVFADYASPSIDATYFPNMPGAPFWSATTYARDPQFARHVDFNKGLAGYWYKQVSFYGNALLVRGGPF